MSEHTPGVMHQVPRLTMLECGCRATEHEPLTPHALRLITIKHCPLHKAAPDLLAALKRVVAACDTSVNLGMWESARTAIARAEGAS